MKTGLTISESTLEGIQVLRISGYLDGHTFVELERRLESMVKAGKVRVVIDLDGLTYIASAGVGVFINAQHQMQKAKGSLQLANAGASIREIFSILGLEAIFKIHASLPVAVKAAKA
jgi:anti-sigma B factor antagonist